MNYLEYMQSVTWNIKIYDETIKNLHYCNVIIVALD
jgi:hypothetical protein